MDTKCFECAVCLDMCRECINCLECNQILCKEHVDHLPNDRCPVCRDSPFRYQDNIALQRIIVDLKERMGIVDPPRPSPRARGSRVSIGMENTAGDEGVEATTDPGQPAAPSRPAEPGVRLGAEPAEPTTPVFRPPSRRDPAQTAPQQTTPEGPVARAEGAIESAGPPQRRRHAAAEVAQVTGEAQPPRVSGAQRGRGGVQASTMPGQKIPRPCHPGEFRKSPNDEHSAQMRQHVLTCGHEDCVSVWRGPWGSFIGGEDGKTHFHLSECATGRRLNEAIGWNYDDPRC